MDGSSGGVLQIPGIDLAWAAVAYEGVARRLVAQLKFAGRLPLAAVAAQVMAARMPPVPPGATVVPVPPDPLRRRLRGFDPADLIAAELAALAGLSLSRCLTRPHGPRQVGRSREQRLASGTVAGVVDPPGVAAVLVDDVVTTGATLRACAAALRAGGCAETLALTFARA